jgi:hypothetical protein
MQCGKEPPAVIDHIDGDGLNNRITNLRAASFAENARNAMRRKPNAAGRKGVKPLPSGRFEARIMKDGKRYYLGVHDTADIAHAVYCEAARQHHGSFANSGMS